MLRRHRRPRRRTGQAVSNPKRRRRQPSLRDRPSRVIHLEFRELPAQGMEIVAIYHSHPVSPAYPSQTDLDLAFWPEAVYIICSLADPDSPVVRGFRLRDGAVTEIDLP